MQHKPLSIMIRGQFSDGKKLGQESTCNFRSDCPQSPVDLKAGMNSGKSLDKNFEGQGYGRNMHSGKDIYTRLYGVFTPLQHCCPYNICRPNGDPITTDTMWGMIVILPQNSGNGVGDHLITEEGSTRAQELRFLIQ